MMASFDIFRMKKFLTLLLVTLNVSGSSDQNEASTMSDYLNRVNAKKFMIR